MRLILLTLGVLALAACATTGTLQRECAAVTQGFSAEVSCLESQVAATSYLAGDSYAQEYVLTGKSLVQQMQAGQISENEARMRFARKYNQLRLEQQQLSTLSAVEWDALSPRYTDCDVIGADRVRCYGY